MIIWRGKSKIDGKPIVVIAPSGGSKNSKTGAMLQTYILRADVDPVAASRTGADVSICGDCRHRGTPTDRDSGIAAGRSCYVRLDTAPLAVWLKYARGGYVRADSKRAREILGRGRAVRLGTYGDPSAVPTRIWADLLRHASGWTGYSHQWRARGYDAARLMASVDNPTEARDAWGMGYRTFRVLRSAAEIDRAREVLCPASAEGGYRTTCDRCQLCQGTTVRAKSIAIVVHGAGRKHFTV